MESNLVYGLTIKERVDKMYNLGMEKSKEINREALNTWRNRPTLVDNQLFMEMLNSQKLSEEDYGLGVRTLSEEEKEILYNSVKNERWIQKFMDIINKKLKNNYQEAIDFSFPLRKHLFFIENSIRIFLKKSEISFSEEAIIEYLEAIMQELLEISLKTFVYDLQVYKDENRLFGKTENERFLNYIKVRFVDNDALVDFFYDYPALTRLLSIKVEFIIENFYELVEALIDSKEELYAQFELLLPFEITNIILGAGDTHDKGKTVSIIEVNGETELVCKPKNLTVSKKFDAYIDEIQLLNPQFDFYSINRIVKDRYTIEEKLPHKECKNKEEVNHFYRQFGHTIALIYLLNGNDFHFENIIAYGKYPLLIDLETIVQNYFPPKTGHAFENFFIKSNESVLISGLLPVSLFDERKEDDVESAGRGLQLSALSGDAQKIPFKMLQLVNYDTDEMQYEYKEQLMEGSENIPMMNGEKIDFTPYIEVICEGFNEFSHFFIENKTILIEKAETIFSDCIVRHVIKTTQNYTDMLSYSMHPTCMLSMCEREKVLENLWVNYYTNNEPVPYEIRDMLQGDIPIFYCNTSSTDLIESEGKIIPDIYATPGIERMIDRMKNFDLKDLQRQNDFMSVALGQYTTEIPTQLQIDGKKIKSSGDVINVLLDSIGQWIIDYSIEGENSITWPYIKEVETTDHSIEMINENFYDGLTGIYLFLSQLYFLTKNEDLKNAYEKAESLVIELSEEFIDGASPSAFFGSLSAVYPLLLTYAETKEKKYLDYIEIIAEDFIDEYSDSDEISSEWLNGTASTAVIFCHLYHFFEATEYLDFAEKIIKSFQVDTLKTAGFGHGYSGLVKACLSYLEIKEDEKILDIMDSCLINESLLFNHEKQGWIDLRNEGESIADMWCYGTAGVGFGRLALLNAGYDTSVIRTDFQVALERILSQKKIDSCICHGIMGDISFLIDAYNSCFVSEVEKERIKNYLEDVKDIFLDNGKIAIEGLESFPSIALFTGLSGVGYELLRITSSSSLPNVLTLEYPKLLGVNYA